MCMENVVVEHCVVLTGEPGLALMASGLSDVITHPGCPCQTTWPHDKYVSLYSPHQSSE